MRDRRWGDVAVVAAIVALLGAVLVGLLSGGGPPRDRAAELESRLRCPVCKQVSIRDSPSETAAAMRRLVRAQVEAGRSDAEVVGFFQARYGDWILLDPPASGRTTWLFVLPVAAAAGGILLVRSRAGAPPPPAPLAEADRARVAASLAALPPRDETDDEP